METKNLKDTFTRLSEELDKTGQDLNKSFEEKQHTLKTMCATYFAKTEVMVKENNSEVKDIQKKFNVVEGSMINPAKVVDARLFALN